ncbi:hypothetical protein ACFLY2_03090 [Patescibacteria group bacterium]
MLRILNFIEKNEDKMTPDIIYQDLKGDFNSIFNFIKQNQYKIK